MAMAPAQLLAYKTPSSLWSRRRRMEQRGEQSSQNTDAFARLIALF
jgi:hypothetical protein